VGEDQRRWIPSPSPTDGNSVVFFLLVRAAAEANLLIVVDVAGLGNRL
jgi:hypothetical protein